MRLKLVQCNDLTRIYLRLLWENTSKETANTGWKRQRSMINSEIEEWYASIKRATYLDLLGTGLKNYESVRIINPFRGTNTRLILISNESTSAFSIVSCAVRQLSPLLTYVVEEKCTQPAWNPLKSIWTSHDFKCKIVIYLSVADLSKYLVSVQQDFVFSLL